MNYNGNKCPSKKYRPKRRNSCSFYKDKNLYLRRIKALFYENSMSWKNFNIDSHNIFNFEYQINIIIL